MQKQRAGIAHAGHDVIRQPEAVEAGLGEVFFGHGPQGYPKSGFADLKISPLWAQIGAHMAAGDDIAGPPRVESTRSRPDAACVAVHLPNSLIVFWRQLSE